jgi:hypothetical protein
LIEHLKKQVENANSKDEAKKVIAKAGMILTDDELEMVAGGKGFFADIDKVKASGGNCDGCNNQQSNI